MRRDLPHRTERGRDVTDSIIAKKLHGISKPGRFPVAGFFHEQGVLVDCLALMSDGPPHHPLAGGAPRLVAGGAEAALPLQHERLDRCRPH